MHKSSYQERKRRLESWICTWREEGEQDVKVYRLRGIDCQIIKMAERLQANSG